MNDRAIAMIQADADRRARWQTAFMWIGGVACFALAIVFMSALLSSGGAMQTFVNEVPGWFQDSFNGFFVVFVPFFALALLLESTAFWAARKFMHDGSRRFGVIAALLLAGIAAHFCINMPWGLEPTWNDVLYAVLFMMAGGSFLFHTAPLIAAALYAAFGRRPTLLRILGVAVLALGIGVLLFAIGWNLFSGETD